MVDYKIKIYHYWLGLYSLRINYDLFFIIID